MSNYERVTRASYITCTSRQLFLLSVNSNFWEDLFTLHTDQQNFLPLLTKNWAEKVVAMISLLQPNYIEANYAYKWLLFKALLIYGYYNWLAQMEVTNNLVFFPKNIKDFFVHFFYFVLWTLLQHHSQKDNFLLWIH